MSTTEQQAVAVASRLTRFRECVDAIPYVAERLTLGQQFNAYDSALNAEDDADEDCTMYVSIGPITDMRSIVTVEGRAEGEMIAHALTFAGLASVSSASAEGFALVPRKLDPAMASAGWSKVNVGLINGDQAAMEQLWIALVDAAPKPEPVPATNQAGEAREGCVGTMDAARATYFLERFKREEKLLGPHEQWALDFTIAALATQPATSQEGEQVIAAAYRAGYEQACEDNGDRVDEDDLEEEIALYIAGTPTPPTLSEDLRESIKQALQCTPLIRVTAGNQGQPVHVIEYDCGDPWGILIAALARAQVKAS